MSEASVKITKSERALLRRLAEEAWGAELTEELERLFEDFCKWTDHGISVFDLSERIHEFHDGVSRELYSRYTNLDPDVTVARAIAKGLVGEDVLGDSLRTKLARQIEFFRSKEDE